ELLEKRGVLPVDTIDEIDEGIVVIRAHGISPEEREQLERKNVEIFDATCPRVARVQSIIREHALSGYKIIIVGDREHPEVTALMGYSSDQGTVIRNRKAVDKLPPHEKICVVAQTTQNLEEYDEITDTIRKKFPVVEVFDTICRSTEERQAEVRELAVEMDAIIIVGGKNSANTRRLAVIAQKHGTPTFHIETADELRSIDLSGYDKMGVSAGASTPNWITDGVVDYLLHYKDGKRLRKLRGLYNLWIFMVRTDIYSAIGAGCLSLVGMLFQGIGISIINIMIASTYVYAMHTINRLQDRNFGRIKGSFREETYIRHKDIYMTFAILSLIMALALSFVQGTVPFMMLLLMSLFGILYNIKIFPSRWRLKRLVDIPGSKNVFTATAWALATVLIPRFAIGLEITAGTIVAFLFIFNIVFVKSALSDMIDIQSDRLVGRETIPVVVGEQNTRKLLQGTSIFTGIVLVLSVSAGYASSLSLVILISIFYIWICLKFYDRKARFSNIVLEGLLGTNNIIAGFSAIVWFVVERHIA
ncbi:MAG: 4-hydroxy-3-methylbut-2-enyl diphosphate reductase, partial [Syntrophaceae bacterium]|nr:4-hydroxy-3-methylbut-2-enyl diphosphate reductase [Syntrophaceae bacterium]